MIRARRPVLSQDSLDRAVRAAGIDAPPLFLEETSSTNTHALQLAERGAPEWTVVAAGNQTSGRGRMGRSWASVPGKSLLLSVILRPPLPPKRAPLVTLLAAARMAWTCEVVAGVDETATEWPNDLMVGNRKVGGILAEARISARTIDHVVVGVGLNVGVEKEDLPEEVRDRATSLLLEGAPPDLEHADLLADFLDGLRTAYLPGDPEFPVLVIGEYAARSATLGRRVRATTVDGRLVEGTAVGVDDTGGLAVESEGRKHVVAFGEVVRLDRQEEP